MMRFVTMMLAGLATLLAVMGPAEARKRIALSFDDVPREAGAFLTPAERTPMLIAKLKRAGVEQAVFFVNPGFLTRPDRAGGAQRIAAYVAAGHVIANHSMAHRGLTELTTAEYLGEIDRAEAWLEGRAGYRPWYRFPFLNEGGADRAKRDAVRAGLAARGLRNAQVTTDGADWQLEALTQAAARDGRTMDRKALGRLYVETMLQAANFHDALAVQTTGRSPAHMMLLHETDLAALYIADFVAALKADGWEVVTADTAMADPAQSIVADGPSANGTLFGQLMQMRDPNARGWPPLTNADAARRAFETRVVKR